MYLIIDFKITNKLFYFDFDYYKQKNIYINISLKNKR